MRRSIPLPVAVALVIVALASPIRLTFAAPAGPIVLAPGESVTIVAATPEVSPSPSPTFSATPDPTVAPTPTLTPSPPSSPVVSASPTPVPTSTAAGNILGIDLSTLPTSGAAWTSLRSFADGSIGTVTLGNQDSKADVHALAAALVYARTGESAYRAKVVAALDALTAYSGKIDSLANYRITGGFALAAALVDDHRPATEATFVRLLTARGDHNRWWNILVTSSDAASNYGSWALASRIAIHAYLDDRATLEQDFALFAAYSTPATFNKTAAWTTDTDKNGVSDGAEWSCLPDTGTSKLPIGINPADCPNALQANAPVEDAARADYPTVSSGYVTEFLTGLVEHAILLDAAGFPAWSAGDRQVCRAAAFLDAHGGVNFHPVGYFMAPVLNAECGTAYAERTPDWGGRQFGGASWLWP